MPKVASRLEQTPPYLFAELDRQRREAVARGVDVIDLGIGDPVDPTPARVVERLAEAARDPATHRYPSYEGSLRFRQAVAGWYRRRFGVELEPERQVMALIGSKEGLAHLIWAYAGPGDVVLVPDPAYPVYRIQTLLAGAEPWPLPLERERGFLPDLEAVPEEVARRAKLLFLNYPNNPTAAVAGLDFWRKAVEWARRHDVLLVSDAAYVENTFDGFRAPSVLEVDGAAECAVEFYSLSKPFNMTGWRIAAAVGRAEALAALGRVKTNLDSGPFTAVQEAAVAALEEVGEPFVRRMNEIYRRRRDRALEGLARAGLEAVPSRGTFYLWVPTPAGETAAAFAARLFRETGVMVAPGSAYGEHGEGYFRISLTVPDARLEEAMRRIEAGFRA
ncbi:MAG: LL-diaminopimelate aminotransferase [Clostridia bacterium]|nr:LL-diaminopimelate aminotransferase [Clostridia bacterium]